MKHNIQHIRHRARTLVIDSIKDMTPRVTETNGIEYDIFHLGQVEALAPSGQSYTPMQSLTLSRCPRCHGYCCQYCGETGSREFYEDQTFFGAIEKAANRHAMYMVIEEGEIYLYKPKDTNK